jgi:hypothetical protein
MPCSTTEVTVKPQSLTMDAADSDVLVWFGLQTMVLVWFQLVLVPESSNQNQNHGSGFGLVWFWFKPWFRTRHS